MKHLIPPMLFVIVLFLSVKIGLMVSFGTMGDLSTIVTLGIVPMLLSYIIFLVVGSSVLWFVGRFFDVTIFSSVFGSMIAAAIILIPFSLGVINNLPEYNDYIFNIFTFLGLLFGVFIHAFTFFYFSKKVGHT
jgi:hypothetical protein